MENWGFWLVPLVVLVVWIVANLFKIPKEDPRQIRRQQRPPGAPPRSGSQTGREQPVTDLDRFLHEARRRREQAEKNREAGRPVPPPIPAPARTQTRESAAPIPMVRPVGPRPERKQEPVVLKPAPPERTRAEAPERMAPVRQRSGQAVNVREYDSLPQPAGSSQQPSEQSPRHLKRNVPRTPKSVMAMFQNAESAKNAFVLREILDRPVSQRQRR